MHTNAQVESVIVHDVKSQITCIRLPFVLDEIVVYPYDELTRIYMHIVLVRVSMWPAPVVIIVCVVRLPLTVNAPITLYLELPCVSHNVCKVWSYAT